MITYAIIGIIVFLVLIIWDIIVGEEYLGEPEKTLVIGLLMGIIWPLTLFIGICIVGVSLAGKYVK